jgi:uncharacterized protein (UPF0332 family)
MNLDFQKCLKNGKITEFSRGKSLYKKELQTAVFDLERAGHSLKAKDFKWATIQCYYSMFHAARALLYLKNYRERSHYYLIIAVKELYREEKLLSVKMVEDFKKAKLLRENADYYDDWNKTGAGIAIDSAKKFLEACTKIISSRTKI